jgi:hypothetical protein
MKRVLALACFSLFVVDRLPGRLAWRGGAAAVRGPLEGALRGPGGVAVRGPGGGAAYRGPAGGVAARARRAALLRRRLLPRRRGCRWRSRPQSGSQHRAPTTLVRRIVATTLSTLLSVLKQGTRHHQTASERPFGFPSRGFHQRAAFRQVSSLEPD